MNKKVKSILVGIGAIAALSALSSGVLYACNNSFANRIDSVFDALKGNDKTIDDEEMTVVSVKQNDIVRIDLVKMKALLKKKGIDLTKYKLSAGTYPLEYVVEISNSIQFCFDDIGRVTEEESTRQLEYLNSCDGTETLDDVCDGLGYVLFGIYVEHDSVLCGDLVINGEHIYDFSLSDYADFITVVGHFEFVNLNELPVAVLD